MKKVFLAFAVVAAFAACNDNNGSETTTKTDSPVVIKTDSPVVIKVDSPATAAPKTEVKKDSPAVKK